MSVRETEFILMLSFINCYFPYEQPETYFCFPASPICKKASDTGSAEEGDHIIYHPLFRVKEGDTIDDDARTIGIRKYSSKLGHIFTVS